MADQPTQRRLAAILAADVVGYSRLMEADEAATLTALKVRRKDVLDPLVSKYQGRIFKTTGDGVLVEFASAVNAVQCAVELQQGMAAANNDQPEDRRIVLRIGVNLGDVMVEGSDLYGDGINIAARLEGIAEPGGILVSGTAYDQVKNKTTTGFDELGPQTLKNIADPVRAYRCNGTPVVATMAKTATERPSIAVLPFSNMSGDPEQDYFSDGITEDIITELSRFRSLFVIARNSSFAFKASATDVRNVGRKLGVRYVVEGSVRRAGNRIRVTAQLTDAEAGNHVWAERYDRELADIFDVQDEVTRQIVINIAPRLQAADHLSAKRRTPEDMRAYDHYLQAKVLIDAPRDISDLELGREHCDRAIEIDPGYARAHAYKSSSYTIGLALMELGAIAEWQAKALASAERAVELDPLDNVSHWVLGEAAFWAGQPDRARQHIREALALNPNDADVLAVAGYIEAGLGDPEAGLRNMQLALERNPTIPRWYHWVTGVTLAALGRYEEALKEYNRYGSPHADIFKLRAIAMVQLGRFEEARAQVRALLKLRPDMTIAIVQKRDACMSDADVRIESLRLAGLPE
jgi:TolB-like protein/Flp pilus assembly protein TadD